VARGKIVLIEGTDKSGKQTQTNFLQKKLESEGVLVSRFDFPRYETPSGRVVGQCYLGKNRWGEDKGWFGNPDAIDPKVASLYYAADRCFNLPKLNRMLEEKDVVILDRYVSSNMGHQGGKIRDVEERNEFYGWLDSLEYGLLDLPRPDITFLLFMPWQVGRKLAEGMDEKMDGHENNEGHLKREQEAYLQLADIYDWERIDCTVDGTIDTLKSPEFIAEEVWGTYLSKFHL
jgi:dTMP kinase